MKKILMIFTILLFESSILTADMLKHDLQVFTANTMEIPCGSTPKELYFGEYKTVAKKSTDDMKTILNGGISQVGGSVGSWVSAGGIDAGALGANLGAGLIGTLIGTAFTNAVYSSMDDHEYLLISECNSGKKYTRLITMVISAEKMDLSSVKSLATADQRKMARKVVR